LIADDTIAEIRARADIVAVIGQHVQLRKAGRNWKGLCPFHGEKTPSFNVHPDKNFFYCFGCQKKGDSFTFVMEYEGKSFLEAAEQLAARFGVVIPKIEESPELRRARGERSAMLDLNRSASEFFRATLKHPQQGAAGRAYLDQRGCDQAIIEKFQLGYGPADWHALADFLQVQKQDLDLAVKLGLIARQPCAGGFYDRYRDRLVCPVIVPGGEIVGFSARIVGSVAPPQNNPDRGEAPKYINSPESTVYKKSRLLFGLAQARETLSSKNRAVLVEGNFDVVTLHQAGITETVAPLGTALTTEQIEQLRRMTSEVVLCYDGDRAGRNATRSALEMLVAADIPVRVVALPDGEDPDSMVRNHGGEKLAALVERAQGGIEFFCFEVWGRSRGSADTQSRALEDAVRLIAKVENPTKRDLIIGTLATAMQLDPTVIRKALARAASHGAGQRPSQSGPAGSDHYHGHPNAPGAPSTGNHDRNQSITRSSEDLGSNMTPAVNKVPAPTTEIELMALFTDHPGLIASPDADKAFSLLTDGQLRDMYSAARGGTALTELVPQMLPEKIAQRLLSAKYATIENPKVQLNAMLQHLQHSSNEAGLAQLKLRMAEAHRRGDRELARQLAVEISNTRKQVV
jgi:DNA primase